MSFITRRHLLRLLVSGSALALIGRRAASAPAAISTTPLPVGKEMPLTPELTEGPYYIDLERIRRDITEGKPGVPLRLKIRVVQAGTGAPLAGAAVDLWHCDAQGVYSGFSSHSFPPGGHPPGGPGGAFGPGHPPPFLMAKDGKFPPPPGGPHGPGHPHKPDNNLTFLRGVQITDADGVAEIDTIYPGWYMGRTTHIHVRVHLGGRMADGRYQGGHITHTGQIFLPEETTSQVYRLPAYVKKETGRMPLEDDGIFREGGGQVTPLTSFNAGYLGEPLLVIDPAATPARV